MDILYQHTNMLTTTEYCDCIGYICKMHIFNLDKFKTKWTNCKYTTKECLYQFRNVTSVEYTNYQGVTCTLLSHNYQGNMLHMVNIVIK